MSIIPKRLHYDDIIISILLIVLSVWVYWYAGFLIHENTKPISAHTFPRALAVMLGGISVVILLQSLWQSRETSADTSHRIAGLSPNLFVIVMLITLGVYTAALPYTGYIYTSLFMFALWLWLLGIRHIGMLIGFTVGVVGGVYFLFQSILNVPLP